jgi:contact-dependent growth inhibition (CDI) system CdiI-like immunity protein
MLDISVKITSKKPKKIRRILSLEGRITIGDFWETIIVPIGYWTREDYERQWKEGLERLKTYNTSCLVVTACDKNTGGPFIDWWRLYRIKDTVFIQNGWLMLEAYQEIVGDKPFTPDTCYDFVMQRETITEEGEKISEWSVPWTEQR